MELLSGLIYKVGEHILESQGNRLFAVYAMH
jgi:hypothetical protein